MHQVHARFGAALRQWRKRRQLTQEQLAEKSTLSYKFIGEVERGQGNPTLETMVRLADALEVELSDMLGAESGSKKSAEYRMSERDLHVVRDAAASIEALELLVGQLTSPQYRTRRRRRPVR